MKRSYKHPIAKVKPIAPEDSFLESTYKDDIPSNIDLNPVGSNQDWGTF